MNVVIPASPAPVDGSTFVRIRIDPMQKPRLDSTGAFVRSGSATAPEPPLKVVHTVPQRRNREHLREDLAGAPS